jgi:prolyl 4-hydroxylase
MSDAKLQKNNGSSVEKSRLGQAAWIDDDDAVEYFYSLNNRIETFTGYSTQTAELYQIVNYGLGGHYSPHYDPFHKETVRNTILIFSLP